MMVFTVIDRRTLEKSLAYLVCPLDKSGLELSVPKSDFVSEGEYECRGCNARYEIRNGVPYFFERANGYEWNSSISNSKIVESIVETVNDKDLTWAKVISLSGVLMKRFGSRKKSIDTIFEIAEDAARKLDKDYTTATTAAFLTQAATAARYDTECYRGTFLVPEDILSILKFIRANYEDRQGIVVEGACANGECLVDVSKSLNSDFYLGLDISGSLVRTAQKEAAQNMLFVQGDISSLPIKNSRVGVYILNNVFDRVANPKKASSEAGRVCSGESFFVLSNCDPLQFGYKTEKGEEILFVPMENQVCLETGLVIAGFTKLMEQKGIWNVQTVAYGSEALPYKSILGGRK